MNESDLRWKVAHEVETAMRANVEKALGPYDCCGCSTYSTILDDAISAILQDEHVEMEFWKAHPWKP